MARLTWDNVTGFNTNAGSESLKNAGSLFGKAFEGFSKTAQKKQDELVQRNTAAAIDELRSLNTIEDFDTQQEAFSVDRLTRRFGEGNFNAEAISKLRDTARQEIVDRDRASLKHQQDQEDRTREIRDANLSHSIKQRTHAMNLANDQAMNIVNNMPDIRDFAEQNDIVHGKAIKAFEKANPNLKGSIRVNEHGKIVRVPGKTITPEKIAEFAEYARNLGYKELPSRTDLEGVLDKRLEKAGVTGVAAEAAKKYFRDNYKPFSLTADQEAQIARKSADIDKKANRAIKDLDARQEDLFTAMGDIVDPKGQSEEEVKLRNHLMELFPESHANFLGIGTQEGGTELVNEVSDILRNGITTDDGRLINVKPWMIYAALGSAADYEKTFYDAASVSITKLKEVIRGEISKTAGVVGTDKFDVEKRNAIRAATTAEVNRIEAQASLAKAQYRTSIENAEGFVRKGRNKDIYDGTIERAMRRLQNK